MQFEFPQGIKSNFEGYSSLVDFSNRTKGLVFDEIVLDFSNTKWFEGNLTAVLGAILNKAQSEFNDVKIENINKDIRTLFLRNHFLSHFGHSKIPDYYDTAIKYRKFKTTEEKLFKEYLDRELLSKKVMPDMSTLLRKKINESIFEIFNNAVIHGICQNIFSCGQYYYQKKRLDFTVVDIGKTIKANVNKYLGHNISGEDSIKWAVCEGHTTKRGQIPGGLGLSLIRDFIKKNKGKIQIVSADGYWEEKNGIEMGKQFLQTFPGTIVNLEFNIDNQNYYCLSSEIDKDNIF